MGNIRHLIALLVLIAVLGAAFYLATSIDFFAGSVDNALRIEQMTTELEAEVLAQQAALSRLDINGSILTSEAFKSLEDKSEALDVPDIAKTNPFEPLP